MRYPLILLPICLLAACSSEPPEPQVQGASNRSAGAAAAADAPAQSLPVVDLPALQQLIKETAASDRVLVVDFWATWCVPCVEMFPALHKGMHEIGEDKVRKVTVTLDAPGKYEAAAIEFLTQQQALEDAYLLDPDGDKQLAVLEGLGEKWNTLVVPAILIFDRQGNLAGEYVEGEPVEEMVSLVRRLTQDAPQADATPPPSGDPESAASMGKGPSS